MYAYDPASIPDVMAVFSKITMTVAMSVGCLLFVLSIVDEASKPLREQNPQYAKIFFRAVAIFIGLILYRTIFLAIAATCQVISYSLFSMEDWGKVSALIKSFGEPKTIWNMTTGDLAVGVVKYLAIVVEEVFFRIRYILLSLLYVIGPIAFVMGFWPATNKFIKGWFQNLLEFSFWIITIRVIQAVFASMEAATVTSGIIISANDYLIFAIIYIVLVVATPMITGKFLSGESMGQIGSMAIGAVSMIYAKVASTTAGKTFGNVAKGAATSAGRFAAAGIARLPGGVNLKKWSEKLDASTISDEERARRGSRIAPKIKPGEE